MQDSIIVIIIDRSLIVQNLLPITLRIRRYRVTESTGETNCLKFELRSIFHPVLILTTSIFTSLTSL